MRASRILTAALLLLALSVPATVVRAADPCAKPGSGNPCLEEYWARYCSNDCYRDEESHPFRLIAYALNPVGFALEWAIMRPIHWVVSRPGTAPVFGHSCDYEY